MKHLRLPVVALLGALACLLPLSPVEGAVDPTGAISGLVADEDSGTPLGYVEVRVFPTGSFTESGTTYSDGTGHYAFADLPAGSYWLQAQDVITDNTFLGGASDVPVASGETTVQDLTILEVWNADPGRTMSGTVTDDLGAPVPGLAVDIQEVDGFTKARVTTDRHGRWQASTPDGDFVLGTEPTPIWELVAPQVPQWGRQYYPDALDDAGAGVVSVSGGAPVDGLDMSLPRAGVLPLDLRDARGEAVQKAGYRLFDAETGAEVQSVPSWTLSPTDALRVRVHPGSWKVLVTGRNPDELLPQWYGGGTSFASAPTVDLAPGETLPLQEMTLPDGLAPTTRPRIIGKPRVGRTLRVTRGRWNLMTDTTVTYRWRRGTKERSASQKYVVRKADRGRWLTAVVSADNVSGGTERRVRIFVKR